MKYAQLTKEQFEELNEEFAVFLATQKIDVAEWDDIKSNNPAVADDEMNLFSDLVWEKVLNNARYLQHFSKDSINLFRCNDTDIERIVVKSSNKELNFLNKKDFNWFLDNSKDDSLDYFRGQKAYVQERNIEVFDLIKKGSMVSKGELYEAVLKIIS